METAKIKPLICYAGSADRNLCKFLTLGKEPKPFFFFSYICQNKNKQMLNKKYNYVFKISTQ